MATTKLLPYACDKCRCVLTLPEGQPLCDCGRRMLRLDAMAHANRLMAGYRTQPIDDEGDDSDANGDDE